MIMNDIICRIYDANDCWHTCCPRCKKQWLQKAYVVCETENELYGSCMQGWRGWSKCIDNDQLVATYVLHCEFPNLGGNGISLNWQTGVCVVFSNGHDYYTQGRIKLPLLPFNITADRLKLLVAFS